MTAVFSMKERNIPLDASWDVIVVGGGPAGCAAAMASADSTDVRAVNTAELRGKLKAQGAFLPDMHIS
jgi:flavin-dependent dehydrogenase